MAQLSHLAAPLRVAGPGLVFAAATAAAGAVGYAWTRSEAGSVTGDFTKPDAQQRMQDTLAGHAALVLPAAIAAIGLPIAMGAPRSIAAAGAGIGAGLLLGERLGIGAGLEKLHKTVTVVQKVEVLGDLGDAVAAAPGELARIPGGIADHAGGAVDAIGKVPGGVADHVGGFVNDLTNGGRMPWDSGG